MLEAAAAKPDDARAQARAATIMDGAPPATEMDRWYMRAFWDMTSSRSYGMAIGGIPWGVIVAYGQHHGLEPDVLSVFVRVIRAMDGAYLAWEAKEAAARAKAPPAASPGPAVAPRPTPTPRPARKGGSRG